MGRLVDHHSALSLDPNSIGAIAMNHSYAAWMENVRLFTKFGKQAERMVEFAQAALNTINKE